jgi:hypothetical protein
MGQARQQLTYLDHACRVKPFGGFIQDEQIRLMQ